MKTHLRTRRSVSPRSVVGWELQYSDVLFVLIISGKEDDFGFGLGIVYSSKAAFGATEPRSKVVIQEFLGIRLIARDRTQLVQQIAVAF